jgi:hypothetical protein
MMKFAMVAAVVGVTATLTANTLQTPPPAAPPKAAPAQTKTPPPPPKPAPAQAKAADGMGLGSVSLGSKVTADGKPLAAGTYSVRVSADPVTPVVGQSPDGAKWVEFVQAGTVKGRELATVVASGDIKAIAKAAPPSSGEKRIEMLKGDDYLRLWFDHGGTHYLVHLPITK